MKTKITNSSHRTSWVAATLFVAALAVAFSIVSTPVQSAIIYADDFTHVAGNLNGSIVQTSSGTLGGTLNATWLSPVGATSGTPVFNYSGSGTLNVTTDFANGYYVFLPLTLQTGLIYTLTVDIDPTNAASNNLLAAGFANNTTTANSAQGGNSPWVRYSRRGTGTVQNGSTVLGGFGSDVGTSDPIRVTLTLNTTAAAYETTWSILNLTTSTVIGTGSFTYLSNPTVVSVFLNSANSDGSFDNFQLSAVPEPSAMAFVALSSGLMMIFRRRRLH